MEEPIHDPILERHGIVPEYKKGPIQVSQRVEELLQTLASREPSLSASPNPDVCPECGGTGAHPRGDDSEVYVVCHCMEERRQRLNLARLWAEASFPSDVLNMDIYGMDTRHPDTARMIEAGRDYLREQNPPMLAILGPNGNGKTRLAVAVAKSLLMLEVPVYFAYMPVFLEQLQAGQFDGQKYFELSERARTVQVLVLDDLGLYKATPWADVQVDKLIGYRYMQGLRTIITSNAQLKQLPDHVKSRLCDPDKCRIVVTEAPDYRQRKR